MIMNSLIKQLKEYNSNKIIPMHMPGGKRNTELMDFPNPYSLDITEIEGFDNLHEPTGILKYEMERAAKLYGSEESLICVNGSTSALTAAICGAFEKGDKVLVARNCHISVINAIILRELIPLFLYPECDGFGIHKGIKPDHVKEELAHSPDIKGVIMTSPTYEGVVSDIHGIASILHENKKILIVDEAHGAHFVFHESFPRSAVTEGADIVVNSLHKTLPALTQTALLHLNGNLINRERVKAFWNIYQTTSPSYVLMGSISACFDMIGSEEGKRLFDEYTYNLKEMRSKLASLENIMLFDSDDPGKIVLLANDGRELYDLMICKYNIQLEMASSKYIVAMTSVTDHKEFYYSFEGACVEADKITQKAVCSSDVYYRKKRIQAILPHKAFEKRFTEAEITELENTEGAVSLDNIVIYPPGTSQVIAGEIIEKEDIRIIKGALKTGFTVLAVKHTDGCYKVSVLTI